MLREACWRALLKSRLGSLSRAGIGEISVGADSEMASMVEEGESFFLSEFLFMT